MFTAKYSRKDDEDPAGNAAGDPERPAAWPAPVAAGPLNATLQLPGSKSLTNRELVLAALADGPGLLRRPLHSRDSQLMVEALRALGVGIEEVPGDGAFGPDWLVTPAEELLGSTSIACGLAGTVMRFVPSVAALALGPTAFDGDESARRRPMRAILDALRELGADIADEGRGKLPFTVHGTGTMRGGRVELDASLSSQFVSGLLLSAPRFAEGVHVVHTGERLPSVPHIEMTLDTLRRRGVACSSPAPGEWVVEPGPIRAETRDIEPDLSNAAPFLAAAVVAGGRVTITGWPSDTTQVGDHLREILPAFGGAVSLDGDALTVTGTGVVRGTRLDLGAAGELSPTAIGLAALAEGPAEISGIGHIRHHETDRIAALATELDRIGSAVTELPEGIRTEPAELRGARWLSYEDHRMATTGALIGLRVPGVTVDDVETTAKTLPQFTELWATMVATASPEPAPSAEATPDA
ncbi:3-phosphoshikimate 1-carboxyvinyltransferase [Leucobacter sp. M11]|uniref:3-phosphoshikimate 1-carboxyvinyltransferase n=1 Tax=Leucobacter sp. M11 TaxID=2993565 RepID=UPI002D7EDB08|nr:3-phosphoshikimate 1-carboxyvinyltransferase [Leucobacter sp. M11]MEB4615541.1 3-phosphoshikimate 1-carboxyvinyltransferase [Leucobacter sp. M11]